jgi:hypothetical protein
MLFGSAATCVAYLRDMRMISERMAGESRVIATRHGPVEYATWASGPAVLVAHGAGGGYDQGTVIAKAFGGDGFRWMLDRSIAVRLFARSAARRCLYRRSS